jgi:ribokinase
MKIAVIGSSNTEMIFNAPVIPAAGETILGSTFSISPGGRGVNQAIAAARAGGEVVFVGRTGNDIFGEQILKVLQQDRINISHVIRDDALASGISSIVLNEFGEAAITVTPGANRNLSADDLLQARESICAADVVLLQLDIPIETIRFAADMVRSSGARVILNTAPALPVSDELLKSISILTPNASQAEVLTGITITDERSAELAGRILLERGLSRVIITLQSNGAMVIDNGGAEHVPGFKMNTIDTSVLNDVFNGALALGLAEGKNFYEAVLFANAAAAISGSRQGTISSMPYRGEIFDVLRTAYRSH